MSLEITVCHHSAILVWPMGDPQDGFFYPIPTLMISKFLNNSRTPDRDFVVFTNVR